MEAGMRGSKQGMTGLAGCGDVNQAQCLALLVVGEHWATCERLSGLRFPRRPGWLARSEVGPTRSPSVKWEWRVVGQVQRRFSVSDLGSARNGRGLAGILLLSADPAVLPSPDSLQRLTQTCLSFLLADTLRVFPASYCSSCNARSQHQDTPNQPTLSPGEKPHERCTRR